MPVKFINLFRLRFNKFSLTSQEEDFLKIIDESAQIEKVYKSYFDMTIVNDSYDETFREIRQIVDSLSTDTQWVPVNWVY